MQEQVARNGGGKGRAQAGEDVVAGDEPFRRAGPGLHKNRSGPIGVGAHVDEGVVLEGQVFQMASADPAGLPHRNAHRVAMLAVDEVVAKSEVLGAAVDRDDVVHVISLEEDVPAAFVEIDSGGMHAVVVDDDVVFQRALFGLVVPDPGTGVGVDAGAEKAIAGDAIDVDPHGPARAVVDMAVFHRDLVAVVEADPRLAAHETHLAVRDADVGRALLAATVDSHPALAAGVALHEKAADLQVPRPAVDGQRGLQGGVANVDRLTVFE